MAKFVVLGDEDTIDDKIITLFGSFNDKDSTEFIQFIIFDKKTKFEEQHTTTLKKEALVQLRDALNLILKNKYGLFENTVQMGCPLCGTLATKIKAGDFQKNCDCAVDLRIVMWKSKKDEKKYRRTDSEEILETEVIRKKTTTPRQITKEE